MTGEIKVRKKKKNKKVDSTDLQLLLVSSNTEASYFTWDRNRIIEALTKEAECDSKLANAVAEAVEKTITQSGVTEISSGLIRELVNNELFIRGHNAILQKQGMYSISKADIEQLIFSKSNENSNIAANNPGSVVMTIAGIINKQYGFDTVFDKDIVAAHKSGAIHVHDADALPLLLYCHSMSVAALLKYGINSPSLQNVSAPPKSAFTLFSQLNTACCHFSSYFAGAIGMACFNTIVAPLIRGLPYKEVKQAAQYIYFSLSGNSYARGGQTVFSSIGIDIGVPNYLAETEAIGAGGVMLGVPYKTFEEEALLFGRAMLEVVKEGDAVGQPMVFPKLDLHCSDNSWDTEERSALFDYACEVASYNGNIYFCFDRGYASVSQCCRLRTTITDDKMLKDPTRLRYTGACVTTINLPRIGYIAAGDEKSVWRELDKMLSIVERATVQRKTYLHKLLTTDGSPMRQMGRLFHDGLPYVDLEKATYLVGMNGLNELTKIITGKELHESKEALEFGLRVIAYMKMFIDEASIRNNIKFALEEVPAESASTRMAKCDLRNFPQAAGYVKGSMDAPYYTNSIHLRADCDADVIERISTQSLFHNMITAGGVVHAFVGENQPSAAAISKLVRKTFENTQCSQLTISPELTLCSSCGNTMLGLKSTCSKCGSKNIAAHHCLPCGEADGATIRAKFDEWQKICEK